MECPTLEVLGSIVKIFEGIFFAFLKLKKIVYLSTISTIVQNFSSLSAEIKKKLLASRKSDRFSTGGPCHAVPGRIHVKSAAVFYWLLFRGRLMLRSLLVLRLRSPLNLLATEIR